MKPFLSAGESCERESIYYTGGQSSPTDPPSVNKAGACSVIFLYSHSASLFVCEFPIPTGFQDSCTALQSYSTFCSHTLGSVVTYSVLLSPFLELYLSLFHNSIRALTFFVYLICFSWRFLCVLPILVLLVDVCPPYFCSKCALTVCGREALSVLLLLHSPFTFTFCFGNMFSCFYDYVSISGLDGLFAQHKCTNSMIIYSIITLFTVGNHKLQGEMSTPRQSASSTEVYSGVPWAFTYHNFPLPIQNCLG